MWNKSAWLATGAAAVIGLAAGIYYFSKDGGEKRKVKFDSKVHTKSYLMDILEELKIEYASLYLHWFNMLTKMRKEKGEVPPHVLQQIQSKLEDLTSDIDKEVMEKYEISLEFFESLLKNYENDWEVKEYKKVIELNYKWLFRFEVPDFKFDYPKEFTKEEYMSYLKISYEKFRFDVFTSLEETCHGRNATDDEFKNVINECNL